MNEDENEEVSGNVDIIEIINLIGLWLFRFILLISIIFFVSGNAAIGCAILLVLTFS